MPKIIESMLQMRNLSQVESLVPFVTGPYCDINPLYLAYITLRVQLQQSSREVLVVGRPCGQLLLKCSDLVFRAIPRQQNWILVKGFSLSYYNKETTLFAIDPYYGNLN